MKTKTFLSRIGMWTTPPCLRKSINALKAFTILLGVLMSVNVWGTDLTPSFSFTSCPSGWPNGSGTTAGTTKTYTVSSRSYTFTLGADVYYNTSKYLMLKSTTYLGLPAIKDYKLTKVVAKNSGSCSTSTKVGISSSSSSASYISGGAIQTWSTTSSTYTYNLSGTSNNTVYYLYVTNKNAQVTELALTYEGGVSVNVSAGSNGSIKAYSNEACTSEITISSNKISVDQNSTVYFKATPNTGYVVDSWTDAGVTVNPSDNTKASLAVGTTEATVSVSFKATPSAESYTVQYNLDGGTYGTNHPTSAEIGTAFAVSPPTKAHYTFTGWQVTSGLNTSTAKWGPTSGLLQHSITSSTQKYIISTTNDIYFIDLGVNGASVTLTATWEENTKYTITFADKLHGESVAPKSVYENETFTFPVIADKTATISGTCEQVHYHFMGWVLSTHEGTIAAGDIKTGTSAAVTGAATYYAVWAKEEL